MGRRRHKAMKNQMRHEEKVKRRVPVRIMQRLLDLPRLLRILLVAVLALFTTLAISPVVDEVYIRYFFTMLDGTITFVDARAIPYIITSTFGLIMYLAGWQLVVRTTVGEKGTVNRAVMWYFCIGLLAVIVVTLWALRLVTAGQAVLF
jgi:hypothetical protein